MNAFSIIYEAIKSEFGFTHYADIMNALSCIIDLLAEDYVKDGNMRDAALDALIEVLQSHKSKKE